MRISKEKFKYWMSFGYKLGRMEFIWDRKFKEQIEEFPIAYDDLIQMLQATDIDVNLNEKSYTAFCESILNYFRYNNSEILTAVLIGNSIQRSQLATRTENGITNELIYNPLQLIPDDIVPDKLEIFSIIKVNGNKELYEVIEKVCAMLYRKNEKKGENFSRVNPYFFISYSNRDKESVEDIQKLLIKNEIDFWIAPDSIPMGSDYATEIVDAIQQSAGVILVLSENSQKSEWVPKELDIAISNSKVVFPIHIDHSPIEKGIGFRLANCQIMDIEDIEEKEEIIVRDIKKILKV